MLSIFATKDLQQRSDQPASSASSFSAFFQKYGHSSLAAVSRGASKINI
jgi:hypothetical protein